MKFELNLNIWKTAWRVHLLSVWQWSKKDNCECFNNNLHQGREGGDQGPGRGFSRSRSPSLSLSSDPSLYHFHFLANISRLHHFHFRQIQVYITFTFLPISAVGVAMKQSKMLLWRHSSQRDKHFHFLVTISRWHCHKAINNVNLGVKALSLSLFCHH